MLTWDDYNGAAVFSGDDIEAAHLFVRAYLRPGMNVVDVGAHQGFYTILTSTMVGSSGKVFAFEPSPRERRRLRINLHVNGCSNVTVEGHAVSNCVGTGELYVVAEYNTGCNSLKPPNLEVSLNALTVEITSLDSYFQGHQDHQVDLIKIDAEGAELDILKGAMSLLKRKPRPAIVCEVMDARTRPWGYGSEEILNLLSSLGYRWFSTNLRGGLESLPCSNPQGTFVAIPCERMIDDPGGNESGISFNGRS